MGVDVSTYNKEHIYYLIGSQTGLQKEDTIIGILSSLHQLTRYPNAKSRFSTEKIFNHHTHRTINMIFTQM